MVSYALAESKVLKIFFFFAFLWFNLSTTKDFSESILIDDDDADDDVIWTNTLYPEVLF